MEQRRLASENAYLRSQLEERHPELYDELRRLYRQDPAERLAPPPA